MVAYLKLILGHGFKRGAIAGIMLPVLSVLFGLIWFFLEPTTAYIDWLDLLHYFSESFGIMIFGTVFAIPLSCLVAFSLSLIFGLVSYFMFRVSNAANHSALVIMMVVGFSIISASVTIYAVNRVFRFWSVSNPDFFNPFSLAGALLAVFSTIKVGFKLETIYSEATKTVT